MPTPNQLNRQQRSNRKLSKQGYRTFAGPLYTDDDAEAVVRSPTETLRRTMILWLLGCCADGTNYQEIRDSLESCGLMSELSPSELAYMSTSSRNAQDDINMKWRLEASWALLWSMKRLWWLNEPDTLCDCKKMVRILGPLESEAGLRHTFTMHPKAKLLDMLDLTLRQHWAFRDDYIRGVNGMSPVYGRVVQERHRALKWLLSVTPWDDVRTDT
jgi:hypothetical protein